MKARWNTQWQTLLPHAGSRPSCPTEKQTEEDMVEEGSQPMDNSAGLSDKDRTTMEDGMPKLTKAGQLQIMQGKSDVIIKLQRELQKDIQDY